MTQQRGNCLVSATLGLTTGLHICGGHRPIQLMLYRRTRIWVNFCFLPEHGHGWSSHWQSIVYSILTMTKRSTKTAVVSDAPPSPTVSAPRFRRLRVYAFDPSLATSIDTAVQIVL